MKRTLMAAAILAIPSLAFASAIDQLHQFLDGTKTARAAFEQKVITKSGKAGQQAQGTMQFLRPGKFRWEYTKPYSQLIVADGAKLWTYDKELNQVVVKSATQALGATPAALLAGDNSLEKNFVMRDTGEAEGLDWLEATPKSTESGFDHLRIGFKGGLPQAMEVRDNFGQTTWLKFSGFERNPSLSVELFRFTPPKGADVVGD